MGNSRSVHDIIARARAEGIEDVVRGVSDIVKEHDKLEDRAKKLSAAYSQLNAGTLATNDAAKRMKESLDATSKALGQQRDILGNMSPRVKDLARALAEAEAASRKGGVAFGGFFSHAHQGGTALEQLTRGVVSSSLSIPVLTGGVVALGVALGTMTTAGVTAAVELDHAAASVRALATELDKGQVKEALRDLSTNFSTINQTAPELARGMREIYSSIDPTFEQAKALTQLLGEMATGGLTDVNTAAKALLPTMQAWGYDVDEARRVSDLLFLTVDRGNIEFNQLAQAMALVAPSAKAMGMSLEETLAGLVAISKTTDASTAITNWQNLLTKLNTPQAQKELRELGVEVTTTEGKFRDFKDILADLKVVLAALPEAEVARVLKDLFPDMQAFGAAVAQVTEDTGAYNTTLDAMSDKLNTTTEQGEIMGTTLKSSFDRAGESGRQLLSTVFDPLAAWLAEQLPVIERGARIWGSWIGGAADWLGSPMFSSETNGAKEAREAEEAMASYRKEVERCSTAVATAADDMAAKWRVFTKSTGGVIDEGIEAIDGYEKAVKKALVDAGIAVETYTSKVDEEQAKIQGAIAALEGRQATYIVVLAQQLAQGNLAWAIYAANAITEINSVLARYAQLQQMMVVLDALERGGLSDPSDRRGGFGATGISEWQRGKNLYDVEQEYRRKYGHGPTFEPPPKGRGGDKADQAADASRLADNTIAVARAEQVVEAAKAALTATTERYNDALEAEQNNLLALETKYRSSVGLITKYEETTRALTMSLDDLEEAAEVDFHSMDNQIRALTLELDDLQEAADAALDPLQADVDWAQSVLDYLSRRARDTRVEFEGLYNAQEDKLYALAQAERAAMGPLDELVRTQADEVQRLQDELDAVARLYEERLLPLETQLRELDRERAAFDAARHYREQGQEIENLVAQLATASDAERASLMQRIEDARREQSLDIRKANLADRISRLEQERDAAVKAAEDRLNAAQQELDIIERKREAEQEAFAQQRENIELEMEAIRRREELANREQAARELEAQKALENAQDVLAAQQGYWNTQTEAKQKELDDIREVREAKQHAHDEEVRLRRLALDDVAEQTEALRNEYGKQKTIIDEKIGALNREKQASEEVLGKQVKDAQQVLDNLRNAFGIVERLDQARDKGAPMDAAQAKALQEARDYINEIVPKLPAYESGLGGVAKGMADANKATSTYATDGLAKLKEEVDPTKDGSTAKLLDDIWNYDKDTSFAKRANTSIHLHGNALQKATPGVQGEWRKWTAAADGYLQKLQEIANWQQPTGTTPEGRASGGPVYAGKMYRVGENGPEYFVPGVSGTVVPNGMSTSAYVSGMMGGGMVYIGQVSMPIYAMRLPTDQSEWNRVGANMSVALQRHLRFSGRGLVTSS